jgi:uncharacterized UBP type Zn finger protein
MDADGVKMIEPKVREDLLLELTELMGFGRNKAIRALHFSRADSSERAIDWIERHEEDADINEPLLIEDPEQRGVSKTRRRRRRRNLSH